MNEACERNGWKYEILIYLSFRLLIMILNSIKTLIFIINFLIML